MDESAKYLIHADVTANGVVEREDVVGAVYGQTEGLLGDELDLRYLQESSKVGRIDVDVESEGGRSFGEVTIATSMDRVETAVLAASLETIDRVGPCRAEVQVSGIEDVRAAKRRRVVERAKDLLAESFEGPATTSAEILEEVRRSVRIEDIAEYEGLPAGPNVGDSDAIIVVEGRADVLQLLEYGIKNAIAVEGTDVPDAVAALTSDRTVTAFLDGDRGGDLILKELAQVGDVDHVALAPPDRSVEDLDRREVMAALRQKVRYEQLAEEGADVATVPTDGGTVSLPGDESDLHDAPAASTEPTDRDPFEPAAGDPGVEQPATGPIPDGESTTTDGAGEAAASETDVDVGEAGAGAEAEADVTDAAVDVTDAKSDGSDAEAVGKSPEADADSAGFDSDATAAAADADGDSDGNAAATEPGTLPGNVEDVAGTGTVRLLDDAFAILEDAPADDAFDAIEDADQVPSAVVLDGTLTQRLLDVAAQRGVGQIVATAVGDLVKQPVGVRVRTADEL